MSKNPTWTPAQVRAQLVNTAQDVTSVESGAGWDRYAGYGMVDAAAAVGGGTGPVAPVAQFSGTPTTGVAPLAVVFTDLSTNTPTSWSWTFGDGGVSSLQNPSHTYAAVGTYTVTLTATNAAGSDGETKTGYITVTTTPVGTWTVITSDNFETGLGSYTDGGADMSRYTGTTHAHQGAAAADIQDNSGAASSFYHTAGKNVSGYSDLEVSFWFKAVSMETGEDFWVQYYDGATWRTVATYAAGTGFTNNVFTNKVVNIPRATYAYPTNAKLRFMCDASDNNDDVYIDEIVLRGYSTAALAFETKVAVAEPSTPAAFALAPNHPNPFNPATTIEFTLPAASPVVLKIFDIRGRVIDTLADAQFGPGTHSLRWDATRFPSGTYFYRIDAGPILPCARCPFSSDLARLAAQITRRPPWPRPTTAGACHGAQVIGGRLVDGGPARLDSARVACYHETNPTPEVNPMWRRLAVLLAVGSLLAGGLAQAAPRAVIGELFSTDN